MAAAMRREDPADQPIREDRDSADEEDPADAAHGARSLGRCGHEGQQGERHDEHAHDDHVHDGDDRGRLHDPETADPVHPVFLPLRRAVPVGRSMTMAGPLTPRRPTVWWAAADGAARRSLGPEGILQMAKSWKCPRCSTTNDTSSLTCTRCGFLQGAVYVPTAWDTEKTSAPPAPGASGPPARLRHRPRLRDPVAALARRRVAGWRTGPAPRRRPSTTPSLPTSSHRPRLRRRPMRPGARVARHLPTRRPRAQGRPPTQAGRRTAAWRHPYRRLASRSGDGSRSAGWSSGSWSSVVRSPAGTSARVVPRPARSPSLAT